VRDGHRCQYCGSTKGPMTVDHVIPRTMKGSDSWDNLVTACTHCNNKKGDRTPEHAGLTLIRKPTRPTYITFIQRFIGHADQRWRRYLFMD
jgi:5-methylcytosine-specific restriction endonuclease McrA